MEGELEKLATQLAVASTGFLDITDQLDQTQRDRSGVCGNWSPKDVMSHLAGWDQSVRAFIADPDGFDPTPLYDANRFNAQSVTEREHRSWQQAVAELRAGQAELQAAVATVTPGMKIFRRVGEWLKGRTADYEHHTVQMRHWLEEDREIPGRGP